MQSKGQVNMVYCLAQTGLELETGTSPQQLRQWLEAQGWAPWAEVLGEALEESGWLIPWPWTYIAALCVGIAQFHAFCASVSGGRKTQSKLLSLCSWNKCYNCPGERQMLLSYWGGDHSSTQIARWPHQGVGRALLSEMDLKLSTGNLCEVLLLSYETNLPTKNHLPIFPLATAGIVWLTELFFSRLWFECGFEVPSCLKLFLHFHSAFLQM